MLLHAIAMDTADADTQIRREIDQLVEDMRHGHVLDPLDPDAGPGPYRLSIALPSAQQLDLCFVSVATDQKVTVSLALSPLKRHLYDYALICASFDNAAKEGRRERLETIDMARRGVHDEGAETLKDFMEDKLRLDKATARRLFSLIYILYKRQSALL